MVNVLENLAATARADDARRDKWAADRGLRPSKGTACLHWISKGRCSVGYCLAGLGSARWMDHMTAWIGSNGERVLICQPYHLGDDSRTSLAEACDRFDLAGC